VIGILDFGAGNVHAIHKSYNRLNMEAALGSTEKQQKSAAHLIVPGVGAFDDAMRRLNDSGLRETLDQRILEDECPILGVCVGMQMMAESSEEGTERGLGWIPSGVVRKLPEKSLSSPPKLPHMGWNSISGSESIILKHVDQNKGFYFLHSYYFQCEPQFVLAKTFYGEWFASAVVNRNIFGFQFHPEKSHSNGVQIFKNFASI
jgi:glutamine amidotransferase